jgi:phage recombination protein Bet
MAETLENGRPGQVIPSRSPHDVAVQPPSSEKSIIRRIANRFGVDPHKMMDTLKSTAFRQQGDRPITNEQMMALMVVTDQYKLNPWTKEIYAFPDKNNGIVPIVGVDGWSRIINEHPEFDGMEFNESENRVTVDDNAKPCPDWIECVMYRKDRTHPVKVREYIDEVYRAAVTKNGYTKLGPWQTHTKRMLRHKAMMQCARLAFGFTGIYDQDEAERILDADFVEVAPQDEPSYKSVPASATEDLKAKLRESGLKPASEIEQPSQESPDQEADTAELTDEEKQFVAEMESEPDQG